MNDDCDYYEIEPDIVRCHLCGAAWELRSHGGIHVELPATTIGSIGYRVGGTLSICCECAGAIHEGWSRTLDHAGICRHGTDIAKPCPECRQANVERDTA